MGHSTAIDSLKEEVGKLLGWLTKISDSLKSEPDEATKNEILKTIDSTIDSYFEARERHSDKTAEYFHELHLQSFTSAISYGQQALRTSYLLNGGALIAIPSFIGFAQGGIDNTKMLMSLVCFSAGLLLTALSTMFGYLAMSMKNEYYAIESRLKDDSSYTTRTCFFCRRQPSHKNQKNRIAEYERRRKYAIVLLAAALLLFTIGIIFASQLFNTKTEDPYLPENCMFVKNISTGAILVCTMK